MPLISMKKPKMGTLKFDNKPILNRQFVLFKALIFILTL